MTGNYAELIVLAAFAFVGVSAVVSPADMISWARRAYPSLNGDDPLVRSVVRFIGVAIVGITSLVFLALILARY